MPGTFDYQFNTPLFKGEVSLSTGLFIDGKFVDGSEHGTIGYVRSFSSQIHRSYLCIILALFSVWNPSTGKPLTTISEGTAKDVNIAVKAAQRALETTWGLNAPGAQRSALMNTLADLMEKHADLLAALDALDNGKTWKEARYADVASSIRTIRYYAGWADKILGSVIETSEAKLCYTRHEPIGVVGQIIPWNFPRTYSLWLHLILIKRSWSLLLVLMLSWKIGPALATGNAIILKPSEVTPLSALFIARLVNEAGFPPGVLNIVNGYGHTVGQAISEHMEIDKVYHLSVCSDFEEAYLITIP